MTQDKDSTALEFPITSGMVLKAKSNKEIWHCYISDIDEGTGFIDILDGAGEKHTVSRGDLYKNMWVFEPTRIEFIYPGDKKLEEAKAKIGPHPDL
jgi:hypothetical protein